MSAMNVPIRPLVKQLGQRRFRRGDVVRDPWIGHIGTVIRSKLVVFTAEDGAPVVMRKVIYRLDHWKKDWSWEGVLETVKLRA